MMQPSENIPMIGTHHGFLTSNWKIITVSLVFAAAAAKSLQSCPTLCDPTDGSPSGSPVPGILQARILEWVAISFSNAWRWKVKVKSLSRVRLLATPWTAAYQAPPSMEFSRQEYWSGVPSPSLSLVFRCPGISKHCKALCIYIWPLLICKSREESFVKLCFQKDVHLSIRKWPWTFLK